jgi:hypothetical protein
MGLPVLTGSNSDQHWQRTSTSQLRYPITNTNLDTRTYLRDRCTTNYRAPEPILRFNIYQKPSLFHASAVAYTSAIRFRDG